MRILALGDCNTMGIKEQYHNSYPEKLAKALGAEVVNLGYTMATTREGVQLFNTVKTQNFDIVLISFGLTDSWETFKGAPYVLYYPDNIYRLILRKIVKKYKKIGNILGFKKLFGKQPVVPQEEYLANISYIIQSLPNSIIILLDTLPKKEEARNVSIKNFNELLNTFSSLENVHYLKYFDDFYHQPRLFLDKTHLNDLGYELINNKLLSLLKANNAIS